MSRRAGYHAWQYIDTVLQLSAPNEKRFRGFEAILPTSNPTSYLCGQLNSFMVQSSYIA